MTEDEIIEVAVAALAPLALYYKLNDCQDRKAADCVEIPVYDLRQAHDAFFRIVAAR